MKKNPAIEVKNLTVSFSKAGLSVVDKASLTIPEGRMVMLIGPNGSGKTTLIKALLKLISYQGEVLFFGKPFEKAYHLLGYVPQRFSFDTKLPITVYETIAMHLLNFKTSKKEEKIKEVLKDFKIEKLAKKPLRNLSGGQLQRVLLARAMVHDPKILILDEPETGIDIGGEKTLYQLLEKLVKDKDLTVLVASHELDIVFKHADLVICINKTIVCQGKPEGVLTKETLMKLYGSPIALYPHRH